MSRIRLSFAVACLVPCLSPAAADVESNLRTHVEHLASDDLEGRLTGTEGEREAIDYLTGAMAEAGLEPLPGRDSFEVPFDFTAGVNDAGSTLSATAGEETASWTGESSVRGLSFSDNGSVSGPVVFAGYGITVPDGQDYPYDSFATLDVEDKIVLVLRYYPEDADEETRGILSRYSGLRYKAMRARELGARALLVVTGPRSPNAGETIPMTFDSAISGSGLLAASISGEVAEALFTAVDDHNLESAQASFDDANPHAVGFDLPGVELELEVEVERERRIGYNLVGHFPTAESPTERPWVVLGAHFDHLGRGSGGNSLASKEEAGEIHNGADDNASGTAAVLEAARWLAERDRNRPIAVALWSGEELGLLGSSAFAADDVLPMADVAAYVNLDMVGRLRDGKLTVQAVGSSDVWPSLVERANVPVGLDLTLQDDPYLPTDSSTFNLAEVPNLHLFTGSHEDYHRPSDDADKINYEGLTDVTRFAGLITDKLANLDEPPEFVKVAPKRESGGDRDTVRAFTGTIPDYTTEVEGLQLSGVVGGGPADEAGLTGGDVIVEIAGQTITNIYDYTYALDALKIGEPTKVVFLRDGERREATIVPRVRD